jgi:hypothetical protein
LLISYGRTVAESGVPIVVPFPPLTDAIVNNGFVSFVNKVS